MTEPLWVPVVQVLANFVVFLLLTALLIWAERRIVAVMQSRLGPNRIGPFGILQTLVDGVKMFFKEDPTPSMVEKGIYGLAPVIAVIVSFMTVAVVPIGGEITIFDETFTLLPADPDIGALWFLAMGSLHVYAVFLAGWASQSPYPLMGGIRASAQMISYEIAQGLALGSVLIYAGTLRVSDIVAAQATGNGIFPGAPNWFFLPLFPAFIVFVIGMIAESQRPPFDLAEAEGELVAGFHTEYSGMRFGMFMLSEFMGVVIQSAVVVTLFFGGPAGPTFGPEWLQAILPIVYFLAKTSVFIFFFVLLRAAEVRARYDKLMDWGWKILIPIGLVWAVATAALVTIDDELGTDGRLAPIVGGVLLVLSLLIAPLVRRDFTSRTGVAESTARPTEPRPGGPHTDAPEAQEVTA